MAKRKAKQAEARLNMKNEVQRNYMPQIRIGDTGWMNSGVRPYESESQAEAIAQGLAKGWLGVAEWRSARVGADLNDPGEAPIVESDDFEESESLDEAFLEQV